MKERIVNILLLNVSVLLEATYLFERRQILSVHKKSAASLFSPHKTHLNSLLSLPSSK
jgi:hypothetical protein